MLSLQPWRPYSPPSKVFKERLLTIDTTLGGTSRGHERKHLKN
jgi:hypothetical protein